MARSTESAPDSIRKPHDRARTGTRATALPRDERRALIIDATYDLLLEHGPGVTTRQIAEAAGVAEGTIFKVFRDKDELLAAVTDKAFDPEPIAARLSEVDIALPLEKRLEQAVTILQQRVATIWQFMTAAGISKPPERLRLSRRADTPELAALVALFRPDLRLLRFDAEQSAQLLRALAFACSHPALYPDKPLPPAAIVEVLLDGIRNRSKSRKKV
ncbi:MAG: TetR/AcrR family transcriptional regulator [Acidimicrobiales bacterium]|nr:TetR/AcrR family transcriptional regulator [Acidimicrobiales bacterium]